MRLLCLPYFQETGGTHRFSGRGEIKGEEDNRDKSKYDAAQRWISAVNNWGQLGRWDQHVCRNPQMLEKELEFQVTEASVLQRSASAT